MLRVSSWINKIEYKGKITIIISLCVFGSLRTGERRSGKLWEREGLRFCCRYVGWVVKGWAEMGFFNERFCYLFLLLLLFLLLFLLFLYVSDV